MVVTKSVRAKPTQRRRQIATLALGLAAGFVVLACSSSSPIGGDAGTEVCPPGAESCPCTAAGVCGVGLACLSNVCTRSGGSAGSVGAGGGAGAVGGSGGSTNTPDAGVAQCLGAQPSPTIGKGCGCTADCDPGESCADELTTGYPGGFCGHSCQFTACPTGFDCVEFTEGDPGTKTCVQSCKQTTDCQRGSVCQPVGGPANDCLGLCQSDADCPVVGKCDRNFGVCSTQPDPGVGDIGAACNVDTDCKSAHCVSPSALFPDGYCTAFCSLSEQGCPIGSVCALADAGDLGTCMTACTSSTTCRTGYACMMSFDVPGLSACYPQVM